MSPATFIRERAPLALSIGVSAPSGGTFRWGPDERLPVNAPADLTFSSTIPGGFEQCSLTLPRRPGINYADLAELSSVTITGLGGGWVAWEGRLERLPSTSGDRMAVNPGLVGWQAHLEDDKTAREIYLDISLARWSAATGTRKTNLATISSTDCSDPRPGPDEATPILDTGIDGIWGRAARCEAWYDTGGIPLSTLYYGWKTPISLSPDANWTWGVGLSDDDVATAYDGSSNLRAAGPGSGHQDASTVTRKWLFAMLGYSVAQPAATANTHYAVYWTFLGVAGRGSIGITKGTLTETGGIGLYASDVIYNALSRWAPKLAASRAGVSTITPTAFLIPQLAFYEPTTVSAIIAEVNRYELYDWAVWEGPTFWYYPRGSRGRNWRARVGPSGLQESGPQIDRVWNGVVVQYNDPANVARTVGPPGSGARTETASLVDTDLANPANAIDVDRRAMLQMGTGTDDSAIRIGQLFLSQQKQLNTSGDATLTGHVEDDHGVLWPAWCVRAGDSITFVDAHDPVPRRIIKTDYSDSTKTCRVSLDSPPESLQAYLDRLAVSLQPLGL